MSCMKNILLKILFIISPLLILAVLGTMQGAWFDVEEFIEMEDAEVHHPTTVQYVLYYLVSAILLVVSGLLLKQQYKCSSAVLGQIAYVSIWALNLVIVLICALAL